MKSAAKEKIRSSGPTRSYLQTRIRGQRLLNAARILALIELSRRLHQAYRYAYDKQAAGWLLPQNPVADRRCPPTVDQIIANKKIRAELNVAFSVSGHRTDSPLEHGGWIYQTRRGGLQFFRAGDHRAAAGRTDLRNPPVFRGATLVAIYHTHPYTANAANNSLREGFDNMRPSRQDEDLAFDDGIPDLVVYETGYQNGVSQLSVMGVGPNRRGGAPDRAGAPGDGFPGNSVDNRGCR